MMTNLKVVLSTIPTQFFFQFMTFLKILNFRRQYLRITIFLILARERFSEFVTPPLASALVYAVSY